MKNRIKHPLWTHLPILAALIYVIIRLIEVGKLPAVAPIHFNWQGVPDSYGSPWLAIWLLLGISVLYIVLSVVIDEIWARNESKKTFNWMSLFDEIAAGLLLGIGCGYLDMVKSGGSLFVFPICYVSILAGAAVILAVILEMIRPFHPGSWKLPEEDSGDLTAELTAGLNESRSFLYWESQNPLYFNILSVALPLVYLICAVLVWSSGLWLSLVFLILGILFFFLYGGMRTVVMRSEIVVRFGLIGWKVFKLKTSDIARAEIMQYSPLKDFGGYGIRFNGKMTAYYLRGSRGVKITTRKNKQYLIGSDQPGQLLAVIQAVTNQYQVVSKQDKRDKNE
jgi:hypothetical protein